MRRDRLLREKYRERFVFTLDNGECFDGLLDDVDETQIKLVDAYQHTPRGRAPIDGDHYLVRARVLYMQRPGDVL